MSDFFDSCLHETIENGSCTICGLSVESYLEVEESDYSRQHQRPKALLETAIEKDIYDLNLSQDILQWVLTRLATGSKNMYKKKARKNIIFSLIYMAHLHLGKPIDPESLSIQMKMDKKHIESSLTLVSGMNSKLTPCNQEGMSISLAVIPPSAFILDISQELNIPDEHIQAIEQISKECIKLDKLLLEENPRKVCIGIIKYYCSKHNINFCLGNLKTKMNSAEVRKYRDMISEVYKNKNNTI